MTDSDRNLLLIIGAGGHGQVALDIVREMNSHRNTKFDVIGFLDDDSALWDKEISGIRVLGPIKKLAGIDHQSVFLAVGENRSRAEIYKWMIDRSENLLSIIHPHAVVSGDVVVGAGVMIGPGVVVNTGAVIKDNVILNTGCSVDHHNVISKHAHIAPGARLGGNVKVGEGSLIGMGSTIIPQTKIGEWSIVGAGALVRSDVDDGILAAGVPAKPIRKLTEGDRL